MSAVRGGPQAAYSCEHWECHKAFPTKKGEEDLLTWVGWGGGACQKCTELVPNHKCLHDIDLLKIKAYHMHTIFNLASDVVLGVETA